MTVMTFSEPDRASRWLLVGSLALNLFFIGTVGALALRQYVVSSQPTVAERPRTVAARIERLAAPLPVADAEKLRAAFRASETSAEGTRDGLNKAFERMQAALRTEPFDAVQLRAAMAQVRGARPAYELAMQEIIMSAAATMSVEGRNKLADWPPSRPNTTTR